MPSATSKPEIETWTAAAIHEMTYDRVCDRSCDFWKSYSTD
jgi:hypothetical protein